MTAAREVELKLRLPPAAAEGVLRHPLVRAVRTGPPRRLHLRAVYFDTPDDDLAAAGIALRIRREGRRWVQAVKGPSHDGTGALAVRGESEADRGAAARPPWPDAAHWQGTPWQEPLDAAAAGLAPRFAADIRRTELPVRLDDDTTATLCVDVGTLVGASGSTMAVSEIEIELRAGPLGALFDFARALAADLPLGIEPRSKAARGHSLSTGVGPVPAKARVPAIAVDADTATALRAVLHACLAQVTLNADGVARGEVDIEWVHQLRIGTRRLRAALALLRRVVPADVLDHVRADARWLARALGPARDLDVLATATLARLRASLELPGPRRSVDAFARRVTRLRREAHLAARIAVTSPRYTELVLAVGALAAGTLRNDARASRADVRLATPARSFAAALRKRRHRKLVRRGGSLASAGEDARHALRLAAKRVRYSLEFFSALAARDEVRRYRRTLVGLQDALGAQNDAAVALRLAVAIAGPDAAVVALLRTFKAAGDVGADKAIERRWRAFAHAARLPRAA